MTQRRKYPLEAMEAIGEMYAADITREDIAAAILGKFGVTVTPNAMTNIAMRHGFNRSPEFKFGPKERGPRPDAIFTAAYVRWANPARPPDNPRAAIVVRHPVPAGGYRMGRRAP